jgi:flagellar basal body rod protein FlgC
LFVCLTAQDLVQQQAQLQALKDQLQADTGYIEQIDIDEMSELVNDLQADKKYYQANIALATSSLQLQVLFAHIHF